MKWFTLVFSFIVLICVVFAFFFREPTQPACSCNGMHVFAADHFKALAERREVMDATVLQQYQSNLNDLQNRINALELDNLALKLTLKGLLKEKALPEPRNIHSLGNGYWRTLDPNDFTITDEKSLPAPFNRRGDGETFFVYGPTALPFKFLVNIELNKCPTPARTKER